MKSIYDKRSVDMTKRFVDCAKVDDLDGAAKAIGEIHKAGFDQGYVWGAAIVGLSGLATGAILHCTNKKKYKNS